VATIQPISTTRVTDAMTRGRLTSQIQSDQLELFRLQSQLSTGYRIFLPSDDAAAAQRAMALQRTIERKDQSLTNLQGARTALATTDSVLNEVNQGLNELRAGALGVIDSISTPEDRQAVIDQIDELMEQLVRVGNSTLSTNYLLGGAELSNNAYQQTSQGYVEYLGDESSPQTFIDIGQLFNTGTSGNDVFGGLSDEIRGGADLNPALTTRTRLDQLNGGIGVTPGGAIEIRFEPTSSTSSATTSVIDLSQAETIDDVARLIEAGAPAGSDIVVSVDGDGLRLDVTGGGVTISEVGSGKTARELGILSTGATQATIAGSNLDPTISSATDLNDLFGSKALGRIVSTGADNDILLTANRNGAQYNGVTVNYVNDGSAGLETADYDGGTNTLTVHIATGVTTAAGVANAINSMANPPFNAQFDYRDQVSPASRGGGVVEAGTNLGVAITGGVDGQLDLDSGLLVTNGQDTYTIDTSSATTVEGLLNLLNDPQYGLAATINATRDGIDVRTRRSGADFSIGENGGTTATQLGIRTYTASSRLADFNRGQGVIIPGDNDAETVSQNKFDITVTEDGVVTTYSINPLGLTTVGDLIQRISDATGGAVVASLAETGNGLVLTVTDPDQPATAAAGTFTLGTTPDTLSITATATGPGGNRPFTVEVVDNGGTGPISANVTGDAIVVDLAGVTATSDEIAAAIQAQLTGFTVTSSGMDVVSAAVAQQPAATTGGAAASQLATTASSNFGLLGDTITIATATPGVEGNVPFNVVIRDSTDGAGTGPLTTVFDPDTNTITVDLQGQNTTTAAIAASIQGALSGETEFPFTVTSSGTTAVTVADVTPPDLASVVSKDYALVGDEITIASSDPGAGDSVPFNIVISDSTAGAGTGPLLTTFDSGTNTITVDLQGVATTTDAIAASIQTALSGVTAVPYTATSSGTAAVTLAEVSPTGLSSTVSKDYPLQGDAITIETATTGPGSEVPFNVVVQNSGGSGPLLTAFDAGTNTITVDLQGVATTTDAIAASIQAALAGTTVPYTVSSSGTAAVTTADVPPTELEIAAPTTGGRDNDSIALSGVVAERLGFLPAGEDSVTIESTTAASTDRKPLEVDSVFTTLIRMRTALLANDNIAIGHETDRLDADLDRVSFARAEVGVRSRTLDAVEERLEDETVTLKTALSNEIDADMAEVISDYMLKQYALQASLKTAGTLLSMSILDYI
jgi:flagellar hook-associated protein 3 FlgL